MTQKQQINNKLLKKDENKRHDFVFSANLPCNKWMDERISDRIALSTTPNIHLPIHLLHGKLERKDKIISFISMKVHLCWFVILKSSTFDHNTQFSYL